MADKHSTWVQTLSDEQHQAMHETLIVATDALGAIIEREDNPGPTRAVVKLVHDLLTKLEIQFDAARP